MCVHLSYINLGFMKILATSGISTPFAFMIVFSLLYIEWYAYLLASFRHMNPLSHYLSISKEESIFLHISSTFSWLQCPLYSTLVKSLLFVLSFKSSITIVPQSFTFSKCITCILTKACFTLTKTLWFLTCTLLHSSTFRTLPNCLDK